MRNVIPLATPIIGFYSVKKTIEYRDAILNGLLISKKQDAEC